jgi:hypothetical protein
VAGGWWWSAALSAADDQAKNGACTAPFSFCGYAPRVTRAARLVVLAAVAGGLSIAIASDFPLCPVAGTFGVPCPGCGLTRATLALLHGDLERALKFHPLVWLLGPLFIGFVSVSVFELVRTPPAQRRAPIVRWSARGVSVVATFLLVVSVGVWLARFAGYFGGPVPVTSLRDWLAAHTP